MLGADNFHSQLVSWSKIILPLVALGLLSTLFLFARSSTDSTNIPFAEIQELAREQRISGPQFSGVTQNGSVIAIGAQSAQPAVGKPDTINITALSLDVNAADGSEIKITAIEGEIDGASKTVKLLGLARLETSSGYLMETNGLTADLDSGIIQSDGALEIRAPFGRITAGQVTFQTSKDDTGQQMLFTQGVKLVYTPNSGSAEEAIE
ncbi:LPS export ABC transporter periplasmic protein LptC [Yoonia sp. MH D7]